MNSYEIASVFYNKPTNYYPIKTLNPKGEEKRHKRNPSKQKEVFIGQASMANEYAKKGALYEPDKLLPRAIIEFSRESKPVHPTQKPVALLEYLIKTYTLEGETVLDFTMGSGSTGVACKNLNRNFIGIERDDKYFEIARNRIENSGGQTADKADLFKISELPKNDSDNPLNFGGSGGNRTHGQGDFS